MTDSLPKPSTILGGILLTLLIMLVLSTGIEMLALRPLIPKHFEVAYFIDRTFYWASIAVLWLFATKVEKQPLLIWKDNRYSIGTLLSHLVALLFITVICVYLAGFLISWMTHEGPTKLAPKVAEFLRDKMFLLFFTALTAGVTEEIIFRGYLQTRLEQLLKNPYWAIFISSLIFGLNDPGETNDAVLNDNVVRQQMGPSLPSEFGDELLPNSPIVHARGRFYLKSRKALE